MATNPMCSVAVATLFFYLIIRRGIDQFCDRKTQSDTQHKHDTKSFNSLMLK
ncbi:hypothetical protein [Nostoc sp. DSM 114161]|uniref:hypothetical protein n=1 Tax=Nostoc sp. DSM 114161 TaxID=3440143 RepID=UPI0040461C21